MFNEGGAWSTDRETIMSAEELTARCAGLHVDVLAKAEREFGRARVVELHPRREPAHC